MSGDMSMGACRWRRAGRGPLTRAGASSRATGVARSPSCVKIENVASMAWGGETLISTQFRLQLREAPFELRDARAKRRDLGLAIGVALGVGSRTARCGVEGARARLANYVARRGESQRCGWPLDYQCYVARRAGRSILLWPSN